VQQQEGGDEANATATKSIRASLGDGWVYARAESVGPTVGRELLVDGIWAIALALLAVAVYVSFRFEWQFGVAALVCTFHDVIVSLGLICLLGLEFNLTTMAALMLLAGYSINDTVIVFDRLRENMRRYRKSSLREIINMSVNATLSRTIMTSGTTILAIAPMLFLASDTLLNFTAVITWGVFIGTFSSVYVAAALLLYLPPLHRGTEAAQANVPA
jgi:preprotein translocase SecF subunit